MVRPAFAGGMGSQKLVRRTWDRLVGGAGWAVSSRVVRIMGCKTLILVHGRTR
jgi:hypothetical protein